MNIVQMISNILKLDMNQQVDTFDTDNREYLLDPSSSMRILDLNRDGNQTGQIGFERVRWVSLIL
jgi:hypothetical protein